MLNGPDLPTCHEEAFKVIWIDGYNRETVSDRLVCEQLSFDDAVTVCEQLRDASDWDGDWWIVRRQQDRLWGGMAELV